MNRTSIVLLSYNTRELTQNCIESIRRYTPRGSYEIIVIDNASHDGSVEWLREQKDIKLLEIFNKYGAKCTFNLNSGELSDYKKEPESFGQKNYN